MKIIVPVSGGKDSTATLLLAIEQKDQRDIMALHNNTGWDHPETYRYLEYLQIETGVEIHHTKSTTLPDLIRKYKKFPFGAGRFCTRSLKQDAIYHWLRDLGYYSSGIAEVWFGIRSNESSQRARKYSGMSADNLYNYRDIFVSCPKGLAKHAKVRLPILDWSSEQVFEYLESKGIKKNPLYDEGTNDRVGCYPCLLAGKKVQEKMFATDEGKKRLDIIRQLEKEIGKKYEMFDTDQGSCEVCKT